MSSHLRAFALLALAVPSAAQIETEDFRAAEHLSPAWTFVDEIGDARCELREGLVLSLPSGPAHVARGASLPPRLERRIADDQLDLAAGFATLPTMAGQSQGLIFIENDRNWLRFDFVSDGRAVLALAALTTDGTTRTIDFVALPRVPSAHLRVTRDGDTWSQSWSRDGETWVECACFDAVLVVNRLALYAANADPGGGAPPHSARIACLTELAQDAAPRDLVIAQVAPAPAITAHEIVSVTAPEASPASVAETAPVDVAGASQDAAYSSELVDDLVWPTLELRPQPDLIAISVERRASIPVSELEVEAAMAPTTYLEVVQEQGDVIETPLLESAAPVAESKVALETVTHTVSSFGAGELAAGWVMRDPLGDARVEVRPTGELRLAVPAGREHQCFGVISAPSVVHRVPGGDFVLEVRFDSPLLGRTPIQGVLVEAGPSDWLRFDFYGDGARVWAYAAATSGGRTEPWTWQRVGAAPPYRMRIERAGENWIQSVATGRGDWSVVNDRVHALAPDGVGVYAGNAHGAAAPAHEVLVGDVNLTFESTAR